MSSSTLFVRNKTDEFIGQVYVTHQNIPDKLIIVDYTRDPKVFASASSKHAFTIKCDHPKFTGFTKFLNGRMKAAVIKFQKNVDDGESSEKDILFILPPDSSSHLTETKCLLSSEITESSTSNVAPAVAAPSISIDPPAKPKHVDPVKQSDKVKPVAEGSSFLSNLLNKVESDKSSSATFVRAPLIKAEVLVAVEQLQNRVRRSLQELEVDDTRTEVSFEPMEPEQRHLVHEVVDEFAEFVSMSSGEDIDRHVIVYKKGHEPIEEEPVVPVLAGALLAPKKTKKTVAPSAPAPPMNFIKVSTVKRDRRTIEDYQIEKNEKKMKAANED